LADRIRIIYFLEDRAQEGFIKALVNRIASEESISANDLSHDVRSARHGSRVIVEFKKFLKDTKRASPSDVDLLIVAIDGNCKGYSERVKELERYIKDTHPFKNRVVYAVPDPYIERWYIMDQRAFRDGVGLGRGVAKPSRKCEKSYYKQLINQALRKSNVTSLLGGAEYAERIVASIRRLDSLSTQNAGFQKLVEHLRKFFQRQNEEQKGILGT
jgi:hypothetical protein